MANEKQSYLKWKAKYDKRKAKLSKIEGGSMTNEKQSYLKWKAEVRQMKSKAM